LRAVGDLPKLHSTGREYMPPPLPRSRMRFVGKRKSVLEEIGELEPERLAGLLRAYPVDMHELKRLFVQWATAHDKGRWPYWLEAWLDFRTEALTPAVLKDICA